MFLLQFVGYLAETILPSQIIYAHVYFIHPRSAEEETGF